MFSRISKALDRKLLRIRFQNVVQKIDESGPGFPRRVVASDDEDDVNLDDLWKHIFKLWKLREKGNHKRARSVCDFPWPDVSGLLDLKGIVLLIADHPINDIHEHVKAILRRVNVAIVAPLVVAHTLERLDASITNREELWHLIEVMYDLAIVLKGLSESPAGTQDVMQEATSLIVEGARVFSLQGGPRKGGPRRSASEISAITQKLNTMKKDINTEFTGRVLTPIQHQRRSHLSKEYPTHAEKVKDVDLDDLWEHISELWEHIFEVGKLKGEENHKGHFTWPHVPGLHKLKEFVSIGTDLPIEEVYGTVQAILEEIGRENAATAAPLVVAHTLERLDDSYTHNVEFCHLVKEMYELAIVLSEIPEETQDVMQEATALIIEGARVFSRRRRSTSEVSAIGQKLITMSIYINPEFTGRVLTPIQHQRRSHLSKEYPTHADNGQVEEDVLWTGQVEEDLLVPEPQKAYIHNNEQVEEDLLVPEPQKVYINSGQVEEDLLVPEPQKAYIHNNEQVEEDLLVPEPQKAYINTGQVEEDLLVPEPQKAYIHNNEEDLLSTGRQKVFKMEALEVATNNFHKDNKVGQGGFGAVYKGTHDGKQIAVKKMSFTSDERSPEFLKKQFENEKLLAEVQHRNLVNLLGSCEQESQGFLVYEYLPNGSLDKFLFDPENRKRLDWPKRYNIMQGIARALQYLHEDSRVRIVHRDIKASNILLDEKLNPKIADFGTANLFPEDRTHVTATSAVGTFGYMAPECLMTGKLSVRTDVYSFGIVLLELLTGEKISSDALKLLGWVWRSYKRKEVVQTIDPTIIETWDKEKGKALRCIQVALLCIQENSSDRPTMSEVTAMLSTSESLPVPKKPPFQPSTRRSWF